MTGGFDRQETAELFAALEDGSIASAQFSHRNHIRAAWHCLQQPVPLRTAAYRFRDVLLAYVRRLGAEDKFHMTLTLAFMHLIHSRCEMDESWSEFEARNTELFDNARGLIEQHYSPQALAKGRSVFAEPDRLPLPR